MGLELEIERAWQQHDPSRAAVPASIWRQLNALKRQFASTAVVIEHLLKDAALAQGLYTSLTTRRGVARMRKLKDVQNALPAASVRIVKKSILEIDWLSPKPTPIVGGVAGETQDCILACHALAYPEGRTLRYHAGWSVEASNHACARFLQRSDSRDLQSALQEAGTAFAAADAETVEPLVGEPKTVYLPASDGCFVGNVIGGKTADGAKTFIYARCRTWVASTRLGPDQVPLPRAIVPDTTVMCKIWKWGAA